MMKAPSIAERRLRNSAVMAPALSPFLARSSGFSNTGNMRGRIAGLGEGRAGQAGQRRHARDTGRIQHDAFDLLDDRRGARQRRGTGQLRDHDDVATVLRRNEALRRGVEQPSGGADQGDIQDQHQRRMPDDEAGEAAIAMRQAVETAIEHAGKRRPSACRKFQLAGGFFS